MIKGEDLPYDEKVRESGLRGKKRNPMQHASKTFNERNPKLKGLNYSSTLNKDSGNFQVTSDKMFNMSKHNPNVD